MTFESEKEKIEREERERKEVIEIMTKNIMNNYRSAPKIKLDFDIFNSDSEKKTSNETN